ncbi:MAG: 5-methyltetrahydropteroyltriglutamate--homocysteine methyltransferase, partial [Hyphomicrobiales bacterium]|nr:5-methyltetrahydropteroyltriglutamate--homocysteine methyltransferase [Hyphomicrobiales bacterium]
MMASLLATTVVGSYPQPDWLVDRELLRSRLVPRLSAKEIWRVPEPYL